MKPAIERSRVVLPQPLGPSRTMNSPCSMSRWMSSSALKAPKCLQTLSMLNKTDIADPLS
ncbi:hypothetical protein D3C84_180980 [compost metagenome]